jgi:hypothetical protein
LFVYWEDAMTDAIRPTPIWKPKSEAKPKKPTLVRSPKSDWYESATRAIAIRKPNPKASRADE